ncbi:hypothetical protein [Lactococcus ileimucosae]|uniref:hypothetical protein n=1 Tax=Lactococcus ileimucosae TaxID=2941329 RepID=UPI001925020B|nr:hypothetical protein [Lactococcus ileimucosae]MBL3717301.1 hypothetical protein [Lactococcus garvieae]
MKQKLHQHKRAIVFFFSLTLLSLVGQYFNHKFVEGLLVQVMLWLGMLLAKYLEKRNFTLLIGGVKYKLSLERGLGIIILLDVLFIISGFFVIF